MKCEVEAIVIAHNSEGYIVPCLESLEQAGVAPIVVDNASSDGTLDAIRSSSPSTRILTVNENLGYGKAVNLGFRETEHEFVVLSNADVVYPAGAIMQMVGFLKANPRIGIVGPQQVFPDESWQRSYGDVPGLWSGSKDALGITSIHNSIHRALWPWKLDRTSKGVPYLDGAVLVVRRGAFLDVGGFDEDFFFYGEETDLCIRLRKAGWQVVFFPDAHVTHIRGGSSVRVDPTDRFIRSLIAARMLLAVKHLPKWKVAVYKRLQIAHFTMLTLTCRFLRMLSTRDEIYSQKISVFEAHARIWRDQREQYD